MACFVRLAICIGHATPLGLWDANARIAIVARQAATLSVRYAYHRAGNWLANEPFGTIRVLSAFLRRRWVVYANSLAFHAWALFSGCFPSACKHWFGTTLCAHILAVLAWPAIRVSRTFVRCGDARRHTGHVLALFSTVVARPVAHNYALVPRRAGDLVTRVLRFRKALPHFALVAGKTAPLAVRDALGRTIHWRAKESRVTFCI